MPWWHLIFLGLFGTPEAQKSPNRSDLSKIVGVSFSKGCEVPRWRPGCLMFWPETRAIHENSCHEEMNCLLNYQSSKLCDNVSEKIEGKQCADYLA
jgi:hypothetical protein